MTAAPGPTRSGAPAAPHDQHARDTAGFGAALDAAVAPDDASLAPDDDVVPDDAAADAESAAASDTNGMPSVLPDWWQTRIDVPTPPSESLPVGDDGNGAALEAGATTDGLTSHTEPGAGVPAHLVAVTGEPANVGHGEGGASGSAGDAARSAGTASVGAADRPAANDGALGRGASAERAGEARADASVNAWGSPSHAASAGGTAAAADDAEEAGALGGHHTADGPALQAAAPTASGQQRGQRPISGEADRAAAAATSAATDVPRQGPLSAPTPDSAGTSAARSSVTATGAASAQDILSVRETMTAVDGQVHAAEGTAIPSSPAPGGDTSQHAPDGGSGGDPARHAPDTATSRAAGPAMMLVQGPDGTLRLAPATAPTAAGALPHSMAAPDGAENVSRMIQAMRVLVRDGVSEATVRLRPDHLGEVSIAVRVDGKAVSATVHAESPAVREWLQLQEDTLRSGLSGHGLSLHRLVVDRDPHQDRRAPHEPETRRTRNRRDAAPSERFEVSV